MIYPVSSGRNEGHGPIKFLIRLAVETWYFLFTGSLSDRGSDDSSGLCFETAPKLSGCQHVCEAQEFNLVLGKTRNVCQNQFILLPEHAVQRLAKKRWSEIRLHLD